MLSAVSEDRLKNEVGPRLQALGKPEQIGDAVIRRAACVSEDSARISSRVCQRRSLPAVSGRLSLAGRLRVCALREPTCLRIGKAKTLAMRSLSASGFADGQHDPS
jgi:hypothetical protein